MKFLRVCILCSMIVCSKTLKQSSFLAKYLVLVKRFSDCRLDIVMASTGLKHVGIAFVMAVKYFWDVVCSDMERKTRRSFCVWCRRENRARRVKISCWTSRRRTGRTDRITWAGEAHITSTTTTITTTTTAPDYYNTQSRLILLLV